MTDTPVTFAKPEPASPIPQTRALLVNRGDSWELFGLYLMNAVLTALTLGIYRFWAKTRIRRYVWGNLEVLGDRLEYTGTGKELFLGFLIVFVLILLPLFGGIAVLDGWLIGRNEDARVVLGVVQIVLIVFLIGVALFRARRYRLTRTTWRGISGGQSGSSFKYGLMNLAAQALNVVTLGLAIPFTTVWLKRYELNHTWVGDEQPEFSPNVKKLYGPFLVPWLLIMVVAAGFVILSVVTMDASIDGAGAQGAAVDNVAGEGELTPDQQAVLGLGMLAVWFMVIPIVLALFWYRGRVLNHFVSVTRFHGHGFSNTITGLSYMWLMVSNFLLVIFTAGLGVPFTYQRVLRYAENRVYIVGDGNFDTLLQNTQEKPRRGEGLADAFDVGGI